MDLFHYFRGSYTVILRTNDLKRFFSICTYHEITFSKLSLIDPANPNVCYCQIRGDQYSNLLDIAKRTGAEIEIFKKHGFPVLAEHVKVHRWYFTGAIIALFFLYSLSRRLWDIDFDGNCYYEDRKLERYLIEHQIKYGMRINEIDCLQLSASLREEFSYITWASAEINGCKLIIHIKENNMSDYETKSQNKAAYDLVAEKPGIIQDIFVRSGLSQVEIGQSINKGDVLISGLIPINNDAMEITGYESTVSDGDIYLLCEYSYFDEIQRKYYSSQMINTKKTPVLQFGNYRISFNSFMKNSNSKNEKYFHDKIAIQKVLKLTDSFKMPIQIGYNTHVLYEKKAQNYTDLELKYFADKRFDEFCANLTKKGVQIYENNVKMVMSDVSCTMSGKVTVIENTGKLMLSKMPEIDGDKMEE